MLILNRSIQTPRGKLERDTRKGSVSIVLIKLKEKKALLSRRRCFNEILFAYKAAYEKILFTCLLKVYAERRLLQGEVTNSVREILRNTERAIHNIIYEISCRKF